MLGGIIVVLEELTVELIVEVVVVEAFVALKLPLRKPGNGVCILFAKGPRYGPPFVAVGESFCILTFTLNDPSAVSVPYE